MKRKRSGSTAAASSEKRCVKALTINDSNLLVQAITQYGVLQSIAAQLFPRDLLALATTSKAAHTAIFPRKESYTSLMRLMQCDGRGIRIRQSNHRKSRFFRQFNCKEYVICGSEQKDRSVEAHPCKSCGITTCDECRIHCVYQSIYQSPDEPDELANFSGFVLLSELEMGILSPEHLGGLQAASWQCTSEGIQKPYHDQGILDLPLESNVYAVPESVDTILDTNLGMGPLTGTHSSDLPHPSPVIEALWKVTEQRKQNCCSVCFDDRSKKDSACCCTLRSRFVDRWLCLKCYLREQHNTRKMLDDNDKASGTQHCACGQPLDNDDCTGRMLCCWCHGSIVHS